ncbi:MAG TPA: enoyl-CoA hydratase [Polyangiaceae bacterium]|nr:enoyl-CoA hydratase [Polyangiaceae bacterium]
MNESPLLVSMAEGIAELSLNRPKTKNALDEALVASLGRALREAEGNPAVRVIVISGQGGAFCSGVDLRTVLPELDRPERVAERLDAFHDVVRAICQSSKPVIASVDGAAVGFGADLALCCDLRVASEAAYFEEKFVALGLMPDGGGTYHFARMLGLGRGLEYLLLGSRIDAAKASELGLVNRVVARDQLAAQTRNLADQLRRAAPLAVAAIKRAVRAGQSGPLEDALARERTGQLELLASSDAREAIQAFLERREPVFHGR